jgi:cytochrome c
MSAAVAGKSRLDLVGDFWNHTPRMIDAMLSEGYGWPTLERGEMADLLSYLYYLRLFDKPGDPVRGEVIISRLGCLTCHSLAGEGGQQASALDKYSRYPSPVMLAQGMWNTGPEMQRAQIGRGRSMPSFSGSEMADLQAYIRAQGRREDAQVDLLPMPNPSKGAAIFESKRCSSCHRPEGGEGPDLGSSTLNMTVSEIGGMLWNHSYAMSDLMRSRGIRFPRFEGREMADLISYLFFLGFVDEQGNPDRGSSLFEENGCSMCHGAEGGGPELSGSKAVTDPVALCASMWNHSPEMHNLMADQAVAWPKFDPGDMADLAAYLRRVAASTKSEEE